MLKITTESGAVYVWDPENQRVKRVGGPDVSNSSPGWGNGQWNNRFPKFGIELGFPVYWAGTERMRVTTNVVSIERIGDEDGTE